MGFEGKKHTEASRTAIAESRTKYRAFYARQLLEYFCAYVSDEAPPGFPMFSGYARQKHVTLRTLENWRAAHDEFDETWTECLAIQEEILVIRGLTEDFNPSLVKFMLSARHGYIEHTAVDDAGKASAASEVSPADRALLERLSGRLGIPADTEKDE